MSRDTASRYTSGSISEISKSTVNHEPQLTSGMDALHVEHLLHLLSTVPLFDLLRGRAVCKTWNKIVLDIFSSIDHGATAKSYCPLVFKRNSLHHLWCGYDSATGMWEPLPPLNDLPQVDIRPLAGAQ